MMSASLSTDRVPLYLSNAPIRFEPLSAATTVAIFFDESNLQVFTVRSNGAAGVITKGPDAKTNFSFRLEDRGEITSMRFSNDMKVLAIQRTPRSVDFVNVMAGGDVAEYSQTCKGKGTKIIGFCWISLYEIVYVTDHGIEQYQVILEKKILKLLKTISLPINWFVWSLESSILVVSSGIVGNTLHVFAFKHGAITRLPKFDLDLPSTTSSSAAQQRAVEQRDVTLAVLYDQVYAVQILPQPLNQSKDASFGDVVLYHLKDNAMRKSDVLRVMNRTGRLSVSVLDNLVVVHHLSTKTSSIFDIQLPCEVINGINVHHQFHGPLPVDSFKLPLPAVPTPSVSETHLNCDLYSPSCVVFYPDVVLDAKLGCFWYLRLRLEPLMMLVSDKSQLMEFLLMRRDSKSTVLTTCVGEVFSAQHSLTVISSIFNKINRIYHSHVEEQQKANAAVLGYDNISRQDVTSSLVKYCPVIDQSDMYTHVFSKFDHNKDVSYKFIVGVLMEYIRSLGFYHIPVQHYLYELIITTLVQHSCYYQLHQFLQYHVLTDSKHLACSLLSLEGAYPPAYQLALDMLKRLQTANESIIEVLLSKKQLLTAIRFMQSVGQSDQVQSRKLLEAARSTGCPMTYFTVYRFIEQRNLRQRGNSKFLTADHCEQYVKHFQSLFPEASTS